MEKSTVSRKVAISVGAAMYPAEYVVRICATTTRDKARAVSARRIVHWSHPDSCTMVASPVVVGWGVRVEAMSFG
jgi:hypothetical protein